MTGYRYVGFLTSQTSSYTLFAPSDQAFAAIAVPN
ncbi:MAG: fasciclin domain-containing protein [Fischerella sp.]|nr:fasciclin domain-containing protein [Fischerella sp.]